MALVERHVGFEAAQPDKPGAIRLLRGPAPKGDAAGLLARANIEELQFAVAQT